MVNLSPINSGDAYVTKQSISITQPKSMLHLHFQNQTAHAKTADPDICSNEKTGYFYRDAYQESESSAPP